MRRNDDVLAVVAIVLMCVAIILLITLIITKGWLLAAIPLAVLMLPWIAEAFKNGADF